MTEFGRWHAFRKTDEGQMSGMDHTLEGRVDWEAPWSRNSEVIQLPPELHILSSVAYMYYFFLHGAHFKAQGK
jgi:hypothetical protein